jgi:hypothetical protein
MFLNAMAAFSRNHRGAGLRLSLVVFSNFFQADELALFNGNKAVCGVHQNVIVTHKTTAQKHWIGKLCAVGQ